MRFLVFKLLSNNILFYKFLLSPEGKNTKSIISQKLGIAQKNHLRIIGASDQFQSSQQIWSLLNKNEFFGNPKRSFWTPTAPERDIQFSAHL